MKPQPEVQIRGDMAARYEGVGKILYACQRAGHHQGGLHHRTAAAGRLTRGRTIRQGVIDGNAQAAAAERRPRS